MADTPESLIACPCCGRFMLTVAIEIVTPPFVVELAGCENCGITSNEFAAPEPAAPGSELRDCGG